MQRQPLIIYVSGAPGSGKTTLAKRIANELYIPHVSSDLIHGGVKLTKRSHDRKETFHTIFVPLLVDMTKLRISFVVDHVLQKNMSESDVIEKLRPHAKIVYVHTQADNPIQRFYEREQRRTDKGVVLTPEQLQARRDYHQKNLPNTQYPVDLNVPTIVVETNDGYEPDFDRIIQMIEKLYKRED